MHPVAEKLTAPAPAALNRFRSRPLTLFRFSQVANQRDLSGMPVSHKTFGALIEGQGGRCPSYGYGEKLPANSWNHPEPGPCVAELSYSFLGLAGRWIRIKVPSPGMLST